MRASCAQIGAHAPVRLPALLLILAALFPVGDSRAADAPSSDAPDSTAPSDPTFAIYGQATNVTQYHGSFSARYSGPNSLDNGARTAETTDATLFAGMRTWRGAELWANAELDQGFGFNNTLGVAGFPSGEAYKVGANAPYVRLPRLFLRQTIDLGGEARTVEAGPNQLGASTTSDALTLTVGKLSVVDIFDTNRYAHDPRADFLNWSVIDTGTFDYAADPWGYSYGAAAEWTTGPWTLRLGQFSLSRDPNGKMVVPSFAQFMSVAELERRYDLGGRKGAVRLLGYRDRGDIGRYDAALALALNTGATPSTALVRQRASKSGVEINLEQAVNDWLGLFARAGTDDGRFQTYEFTEINRSLALGVSIDGALWGRTDDRAGLAAVTNGLSADARRYFEAGGVGILIGDGALRYGNEQIAEAYYSCAVTEALSLSVDFQHVLDPAYNRDRGPVNVLSTRLHIEF